MENRYKAVVPYEYRMSPRERLLALIYLPVHVFGLPVLAGLLLKTVAETELNFLCYAVGTLYILLTCWGYLRREFDPLCDYPLYVVSQILGHYGLMLIMNLAVNSLLMAFTSMDANPNNEAVQTLADSSFGTVAAMAICLAPILEEVIFRGAIFGGLRKKSRVAAYIVSMLLFSLYHIWGYLVIDLSLAKYMLQYLPVSFLLCRIYERTGTLWASIFMHMMVNGVFMKMMEMLEGML